jgi:hypothetical protein
MWRALEIFDTSDAVITRRYHAELESRGPLGVVAANLLRAQKASSRAKVYRGGIAGRGSFRGMAYDRKQQALDLLCASLVLLQHAPALAGIRFGWKSDPNTILNGRPTWVLYVDLPEGQVSFHAPGRGLGPDYPGEWDGARDMSVGRILRFCDRVSGADRQCVDVRDASDQPSLF